MLLLDMTIVSSALANMQSSLGADLTDLQWIIDAYALPMAALLLTAATLGDRLGRRPLYLSGMVLFTAASLGCAMSPSAEVLIGMRAVQGIGGAVLLAVSLPIIAAAFPEPGPRGTAIAVYGAVMGAGSAAGPLLGGFLVTHFGWESIFVVNVPIGLAALVLAVWFVPQTEPASATGGARQVDWVGTVLLSAGLLGGAYAVIDLHHGRSAERSLTAGLCALVTVLMFLLWEKKFQSPLLDFRVVRRPGFAGVWIAALAAAGTLIAVSNYLALYFMNTLGYNAFQAGLRAGPLTLAIILGAPLGILLGKRVPVALTIPGSVSAIAAGMWLMTGVHAGTVWTHFIAGSVVAGLGLGSVSALASEAILRFVPVRDAGMATGTVSTGRQIGMVLGVAGLGVVFGRAAAGAARNALAGGSFNPPCTESVISALADGAGRQVIVRGLCPAAAPGNRLEHAVRAAGAAGIDNALTIAGWCAAGAAALSLMLLAVAARSAPSEVQDPEVLRA